LLAALQGTTHSPARADLELHKHLPKVKGNGIRTYEELNAYLRVLKSPQRLLVTGRNGAQPRQVTGDIISHA
jgi:hypothetical protein